MDWPSALDYVKTLNTGGYTDWRLPNVIELASLFDYSQYNPSLPQVNPFINIQYPHYTGYGSYVGLYWSSTTLPGTGAAYAVGMDFGHIGYDGKLFGSGYNPVWLVRGGQCNSVICLPKTGQTTCWYTISGVGDLVISCTGTGQDGEIQAGVAWPDPRFTDNGNDTITDNLTGLVWTKNANPAGNYMDWPSALDYVKTLNTGGYTDWRLPNVIELASLINYEEPIPVTWLNNQGFTNVQSKNWSSTTDAYNPSSALYLRMIYPVTGSASKNGNFSYYAWPVRGSGAFTTTTTTSIIDSDNDGTPDNQDNCPNKPNGPNRGTCSSTSDKPNINCTSDADCANGCSSNGLCIKDQRDTDSDGFGDVCDTCVGSGSPDADTDGLCDLQDNCPTVCNSQQLDADNDGTGDVCDDPNNDGCGGCGQPLCETPC